MAEWESIGRSAHNYPWRFGYDNHLFRSQAEVEWAKTFDQLGLPWESEPLKFDMGPKHVSYTPDFRVTGLSIPDSNRALYIEVKRFPDEVDLTKYVRFTEWYNCDLLVLAHEKGGALKPKKEKYFLVLRCPHCDTYDCFPCDESPTDDYIHRQNVPAAQYIQGQNVPYALARGFPFGYRLAADGTFWLVAEEEPPPLTILTASAWSEKQQTEYWTEKLRIWWATASLMPYKHHPSVCQGKPLEKIVVPITSSSKRARSDEGE